MIPSNITGSQKGVDRMDETQAVTEKSMQAVGGARGYEAPRVEDLGSIAELTMGVLSTGHADAARDGTAVSDRRMKRGLEPVDGVAVLAVLARVA
jgi:hypothetical protein